MTDLRNLSLTTNLSSGGRNLQPVYVTWQVLNKEGECLWSKRTVADDQETEDLANKVRNEYAPEERVFLRAVVRFEED